MTSPVLSARALNEALALRDLTDASQGPHAMQHVLNAVVQALERLWSIPAQVHRHTPVVPIADNYDRLGYPPDGVARDARYTRYVSPTHVLRTQTSAMVPRVLADLATQPPSDALLVCPGLVYRRDCVDRTHVGEPHQVDLWRVSTKPLTHADLHDMAKGVVHAVWPDAVLRLTPASHPYTVDGLQMDVLLEGSWLEVGECGLAHPRLLSNEGLQGMTGLAMGLGLDRLLMLKKGIPDIRLLRAGDPRIADQMLDLAPYRPVSLQPPMRRDISIAVEMDTVAEQLGDRVREALGADAACVESVEVLSETPGAALPPQARARLGMKPGQKNVLLRIVLRSLERTLTDGEGNALRDRIYAALHAGEVHMWASRRP